MEQQNQPGGANERSNPPSDAELKQQDRQGIDKAPGEEPAGDMENIVSDTQRGKNKVDGDPDQPSDQPNEQSR